MSYGLNVIQVVPLFCTNEILCCQSKTFSMTFDVFIPFYTALACFKSATRLKLLVITTMQEKKTKLFTLFSYEIYTSTPVEIAISPQLGKRIKIF